MALPSLILNTRHCPPLPPHYNASSSISLHHLHQLKGRPAAAYSTRFSHQCRILAGDVSPLKATARKMIRGHTWGRVVAVLRDRSPPKKVDPVGILEKVDLTSQKFALFLRERHKALKDLKEEIIDRELSLLEFASGNKYVGLKRHIRHCVEYLEWAPGAQFCSLVGDFNNWVHRQDCAGEGYLGHDDHGYWRVVVEDKLREGEVEGFYFEEFNYLQDFDKGDENPDLDALFKKMDDEYWEPGEDEYLKNDPNIFAEDLYNSIFGSGRGLVREKESDFEGEYLEDIPDAQTRYEAWKASEGSKTGGHLPPVEIIDDGSDYREPTIVDDPVWRKRVFNKKPPLKYWEYLIKGRKAWEKKYSPGIPHLGRVRCYFHTPEGPLERVPAWATYVLPDLDGNRMSAIFWDPPFEERHNWKFPNPVVPRSLRIYECHIGMSGEELNITSFKEFTRKILPYIKRVGYNAIQLMGIQEHADYSSVGYKVTNMFAVSSRFGTPEDFKHLVDTAHGLGLLVFLDIVQSHAAADDVNGLSKFDGQNDCYFHKGKRGRHKGWHTRMFNYGEYEVMRYLLSNLKWWVEEYHVDGFHFHSVTSMLYTHNGFAEFSQGLDDYCNQYVDRDALMYLILANDVLRQLKPDIITIAEDFTFYPGLCEPTDIGGLGFDYYVSFAPSEMWLNLIDGVVDDSWSMEQIAETLLQSSSQHKGKALVYVENHSQSIVGGKSFAEALFNDHHFEEDSSGDPLLFLRGLSLLKMMKLITLSLGGSAYLNFMGNEFGHPEHVEFPSPSNQYSLAHACRHWHLRESEPHSHLAVFDKDLMKLEEENSILTHPPATVLVTDNISKVIVYRRGNLLYTFNFNPNKSFDNYSVQLYETGEYKILLDTDGLAYGGLGRRSIQAETILTSPNRTDGSLHTLSLYLPFRSAQVYKLARIWDPLKPS